MAYRKGESGNESKQFKPGESGKPGGRPKTKPITDALRELLVLKLEDYEKFKPKTPAESIAQKMIDQAMASNSAFTRETLDRTEGKVPLPITGGEEPLEVNVRLIHIGAGAKPRHRPSAPAD